MAMASMFTTALTAVAGTSVVSADRLAGSIVRWSAFGLALIGWVASAAVPARAADEKAAAPQPAAAAKAAAPRLGPAGKKLVGKYVRIGAPITDNVKNRVRRAVDLFVDQATKRGQWPVVIFEMQSGRTEFGAAHDLAKYLSGPSLNGATTIAYIPTSLTGHGVLPALACNEIIMHRDGLNETNHLGNAGEHEQSIDQVMLAGYRQVADARKTVPMPIALKMLDKNLELLQVETESSREFVLRGDLEALKQRKAVNEPKVLSASGRPGLFTFDQARELGFVGRAAVDKGNLIAQLGLPGEALTEDPSVDADWRTVRVDIKGAINKEMMNQKIKTLSDEVQKNDINFICVYIDSPGGDFPSSAEMANLLKSFDPSKRRTVAYIAGEARGDASLIALACDQIVVLPASEFGGTGDFVFEERNIGPSEQTFRDVAAARFHSPTLAAAIVNPALEVFEFTRRDNGLNDYFTEAEVAAKPDAAEWQKGRQIKAPKEYLLLTGTRAHELGIAAETVKDFAEFKALYSLQDDPHLVEQNLAMQFIAALNTSGLHFLLLLIGGAALYAELHTPGVGIGGFISAVCFVLYFWSAHLGGTAGWLEILLFGLGMICVLMEIFVFPGVGIFGLGGGLLVITSLVLASQTFVIPRNDYQMDHLRTSLVVIVGAIGGTIATSAVLRRFLPHTPMFSRMLLAPPVGAEANDLERRESLGQFQHLVGSRGTATTTLVPSGKARFGEQLVDVISEGEFIDRGLPITVIEVQGTRVVVRQAEA